MRIIGGIHRGRRLLGPKDDTTTRPMIDRVKQSLFDRLWSLGLLPEDAFEAEEQPVDDRGLVVDVFAGTGSLGLEALSRGIGRCVFVEQDRDAVRILEQNLATLGLSERSRVLRVNALSPTWVTHSVRQPVRLAFVDPPYAMVEEADAVEGEEEQVESSGRGAKPQAAGDAADGWRRLTPLLEALAGAAEPGGVMVLRTPKRVDPPAVAGWQGPTPHVYGNMKLNFYERPAEG